MSENQLKRPSIIYLEYNKGDLITKEGDYGLSIYKILKGQVRIFKQSEGKEIPLATLGPGEIFGEMAFLSGLLATRSASARALDEVQLEIWHPAILSKEYEQIPPILKYIIDQTLNRLKRMNALIGQLSKKKEEERKKEPPKKAGVLEGECFRKKFDNPCIYRPVGSSPKVRLMGQIKDIGFKGVGIEVSAKNALNFSHNTGDEFEISTTLPNGQNLDMIAKIRSVKKEPTLGRLHLGLAFVELKGDNAKKLGFFLMP